MTRIAKLNDACLLERVQRKTMHKAEENRWWLYNNPIGSNENLQLEPLWAWEPMEDLKSPGSN